MRFDTKIAVVLRDDLVVWQKTNLTALLVSGIAGTVPGVVGQPVGFANSSAALRSAGLARFGALGHGRGRGAWSGRSSNSSCEPVRARLAARAVASLEGARDPRPPPRAGDFAPAGCTA